MMKKIIIPTLFILFIIGHCYAQNTIDLQDPIKIKEVLYYRDGGTTGVILEDATGKELSFCFTPLSNFFYGATHANFKEARPIEAESDLEKKLLSKIQNAINAKFDSKKQNKLTKAKTAMGLSKEELDIWYLLRSLNLYKEKQNRKLLKKGKSEIEFINTKMGYSFSYPVSWEEMSEGIHLIETDNKSTGAVEASIQVIVENAKGLSPDNWYKKEFDKYKKDSWRYEKELLNYKIEGEAAYRFWNIIPDGSGEINSKTKMGHVVFVKNSKIYSFFYFNQSPKVKEFEAAFEKALKSFQIIKSSNN